jgi:hypothetical protein
LTTTQQEIITSWLIEGVRSNSIAWFEMTKKFFQDMDTKDPAKHLATLLFIDTFNRADSVFDEKRNQLESRGLMYIAPEVVEAIPVLKYKDNKIATVSDLKSILTKILAHSHSYSEAECGHISWLMDNFLDVSTYMQQCFEGRYSYSFDEAHALRFGTVGPFVDVITNIFAVSPDTISTGKREQIAHMRTRTFLHTVLAWQLSDDLYDYNADRRNLNVNLVSGIMQDVGEFTDQIDTDNSSYPDEEVNSDRIDIDEFIDKFPKTAARMKDMYQKWTTTIPENQRWLIDSRVPAFLTERDVNNDHEMKLAS